MAGQLLLSQMLVTKEAWQRLTDRLHAGSQEGKAAGAA